MARFVPVLPALKHALTNGARICRRLRAAGWNALGSLKTGKTRGSRNSNGDSNSNGNSSSRSSDSSIGGGGSGGSSSGGIRANAHTYDTYGLLELLTDALLEPCGVPVRVSPAASRPKLQTQTKRQTRSFPASSSHAVGGSTIQTQTKRQTRSFPASSSHAVGGSTICTVLRSLHKGELLLS